MTIEDKIKFQLGDLIVAAIALKAQLDAALAENATLKVKLQDREADAPRG